MLGTSGNFTNYLVCKCIGGIGLGLLIAAAGIYGAECTVARYCGMLLAVYSIGLSTGFAVSSAVCWGSSNYVTSDLSWQIPIICQIPLSVILGLGVLAFPESPRWLSTKGHNEAAKKSFAWFYAKEPDHPDILLAGYRRPNPYSTRKIKPRKDPLNRDLSRRQYPPNHRQRTNHGRISHHRVKIYRTIRRNLSRWVRVLAIPSSTRSSFR